jgi:hypothetical protein
LEAHLKTCAECRRESFYFAELVSTASRMEAINVRPDFNLRLRAAIQRTESAAARTQRTGWTSGLPQLRWRPAFAFSMAAVFALVAFGSFQYSSYREHRAVDEFNAQLGRQGQEAREAALGLREDQSVMPPQWSPVDGLSPEMRRLQDQYLADHKLSREYIAGGEKLTTDSTLANPEAEYLTPVVRSDQMLQPVSY